MSDELKPCPFCGGKAEIYQERHDKGGQHHNGRLQCFVFCSECSARGPDNTSSQYLKIQRWNERKEAQPK